MFKLAKQDVTIFFCLGGESAKERILTLPMHLVHALSSITFFVHVNLVISRSCCVCIFLVYLLSLDCVIFLLMLYPGSLVAISFVTCIYLVDVGPSSH